MIENINSLLIALVGKDKRKRDKVLQCYQSLEFNNETKVYKVRSVTKANEIYKVIYHKSKGQWFCKCPATNFMKYIRFQTLEDRNKGYRKKGCIHILACRLYNAINGVDIHS